MTAGVLVCLEYTVLTGEPISAMGVLRMVDCGAFTTVGCLMFTGDVYSNRRSLEKVSSTRRFGT
jgi:hypothetical protein